MTYEYRAPERLEDDWRRGEETPPGEMIEELRDDIDNLKSLVRSGAPLVPVEGRVSDYKSWLAAAAATEMADGGLDVTVFAPQRTNRESAVFKLRLFGADLLEHPGRLDLCVWEPWRENVGHVDKSTCESIGCPFYLDEEADIADRTEEAVSEHLMFNEGRVELHAGDGAGGGGGEHSPGDGDMRSLGRSRDFCPAQLYLHARGMEATDGAVNVATYAKAFADAAISDDDPLGSDVLLLDEAHTIAADPEVVTDEVEPRSLLGSTETVLSYLDGSGQRWAQRAHREVSELAQSIEHWLERSETEHVDPDGVFAGDSVSLADSFEVLDRVEGRVMQEMRRRLRRNDWESAGRAASPYMAVGAIRSFLSGIKQYRDGSVDFVHSLYEEDGRSVNEMAFRAVDPDAPASGGTTPAAVYRAWEREGTHPAIRDRWGTILDRYIESLWDGRALRGSDGAPGAPVMPMDRLKSIAGAESVVTLSATHNELSDPTRDPGRLRPTRHRLLCAPVYLRASGSSRADYDGRDSVSPSTPWFRSLAERAKEDSGDSLAAVPINYANAAEWEAMPVESMTNDDGDEVHGLVPNSRGAIGEKGLEGLDIDTVMCGVQVQSPAPTARRLVQWWEMLAPRYEDFSEVLAVSWRLLAQHAVSGTIQAGGRFDWDATNLLFERPGLVELAGFEAERATPESPGFAGALCREYEEAAGEWADRRAAVRAAKVVRYLERADRKAATTAQATGEYKRVYGVGDDAAREALAEAADRDRIEAYRERNRVRFRTI